MYRVKDVMTEKVMTCGPDDSLESAVRIMLDRVCGTHPMMERFFHG